MAKIYKTTDRIKVLIEDKVDGDVILSIAPLSLIQKKRIMKHMMASAKGNMDEATEAVFLALKYSLKSVSGIVDTNDEPYQLSFENGELTDECVNELQGMEIGSQIQLVATAMITGKPKVFVDQNGNPLEGVRFVDQKPLKVDEEGK